MLPGLGRALLGHSRHEGELAALDAELAKVNAGIDLYLRAFETGQARGDLRDTSDGPRLPVNGTASPS